MSAVFLRLLEQSIPALWLILAVILARLLLKKAPKRYACLLWALVAFRLICPFSIESALSLNPGSGMLPDRLPQLRQPAVHAGVEVIAGTMEPMSVPHAAPAAGAGADVIAVLSIVWLIGMAALLGYALCGALRLRRSVRASVPAGDGVFACDEVQSPFLLGVLRPKIYVPSSLTGETLRFVLTHEKTHIRRRDHWWKPLGYLLLCVWWFHPLVWLGYILFCRDMELACDESAVRDMDGRSRAGYSQALLDCAVPRRRVAVCPLAFGEVGVKARVKNVLRCRKPAFWVSALAVLLCVAVGVCFLTSRRDREPDLSFLNYENAISAAGQRESIDVIFYPFVPAEGNGLICIGTAEGNALARYLESVSWKQRTAPGQNPASPGSVEFILREDHRITVWQKPRAARVTSGADARWYRIGRGDFEAAAALFRASGEQRTLETAAPEKWFDYFDGDEVLWDEARVTTLPEFPGVTFRCSSEALEAVTGDGTVTLYDGMPIMSVYFCDLNGDGLRELCSTVSFGSGIIDERIYVADYANNAVHELSDRFHYNYRVSLKDGRAWAEKYPAHIDETSDELLPEAGALTIQKVVGEDGTLVPTLMLVKSSFSGDALIEADRMLIDRAWPAAAEFAEAEQLTLDPDSAKVFRYTDGLSADVVFSEAGGERSVSVSFTVTEDGSWRLLSAGAINLIEKR